MSLMALLLTIFGALGAIVSRRRVAGLLWIGASLTFVALVGGGVVPRLALNGLQTRGKANHVAWKSRNWIVLLGVGSVKWARSGLVTSHTLGYSRLFEAARLYFDCKKGGEICRILATGGGPSGAGLSEAETMAGELKVIGVSAQDIVVEPNSNNTFQNAEFSSRVLRTQGFDLVLIVTSGVHMSRAIRYFGHFIDDPVPAPSDELAAVLSPIPVSANFTYLDIAVHEYVGILRYRVYEWLGWNPAVERAGSP